MVVDLSMHIYCLLDKMYVVNESSVGRGKDIGRRSNFVSRLWTRIHTLS